MKKRKLLGLAIVVAMVSSFFACSNEVDALLHENEIRLTSEIIPSRVPSLNCQSTQIVSGQKVGVTIIGAKSEHANQSWTAGNNGELTNPTPLYWGESDVTIYAYHPYKGELNGDSYTFSVQANQQKESDYLNSDLLWVTRTASKSVNPVPLTFSHMLSKINVTLTSDDIADLSGAIVTVCGVKSSATFHTKTGELSSISGVTDIVAGVVGESSYSASAIILPQTMAEGAKFIKVAHGGKTYFYTLPADKTFAKGHSYSYSLKVSSNKLINVSGTIVDWNNEDLQGSTTAVTSTYADGVANLSNAGDLSKVIPASEKHTLTSLKITGYLNSDDVRFIREMSGSTNSYLTARNEDNPGSLKTLDISECIVVPGGAYFYEDYGGEKYVTAENDLGWNAFTCTRLENVLLPSTITRLGYNILAYTKIKEVVIPESVVDFGGGYVFEGSTVEKVHLPKNLKYGVMGALSCCSNLSAIIVAEGGDTDFFIQDGLLYVNTLDDSGNRIKSLYCCPGVRTSATILSDTREILYSALGGCQISSIEIPASVTKIHWNAFSNCTHLTSIKMLSSTPPLAYEEDVDGNGNKIEFTPFMNNDNFVNGSCKLWVPEGSKSLYGNSQGWSIFKDKDMIDEYSL